MKQFVTLLGCDYRLFHQGQSVVSFLQGEFYWRVRIGESVKVTDYISPPEILSSEASDSEVTWSIGVYLEKNEVEKAFQISPTMPLQLGVAPNQPAAWNDSLVVAKNYWGRFLGVLIVIQVASLVLATNKKVFEEQYQFDINESSHQRIVPLFELNGRDHSNLEIEIFADVENNWVEVQSEVLNEETGEVFESETGIEYYFGRDFDGAWREGSQYSTTVFSALPKGKYQINLDVQSPLLPEPLAGSGKPGLDSQLNQNVQPVMKYWPNGKLQSSEPFLHGQLDGVARYFLENGELQSEITYVAGKKHGLHKIYRTNGMLAQETQYQLDVQNGTSKTFDSRGNVDKVVQFADGKLLDSALVANTSNSLLRLRVVGHQNVVVWANFLWALLLISIYPVLVLWRGRRFEVNRWAQSDFSPYYNGDE
jgi:hypothetical protein